MPHRLGTVAALVLAGSLALAPAAGAAELLDRKKLSKQVGAAVAATYPDLPVSRVRCPRKVKLKTGVTAVCTVTAGTYSLGMLVTVTGKRGDVAIASTQAVIPKALAEGMVANNATLHATGDCGPEPYIVKVPGESFVCTARFDDGSTQQVTMTANDIAGNVTITAVSP